MSIFQKYEEEFQRIVGLLNKSLTRIPSLSGEPRKAAVHDAQKLIDDADATLRLMDQATSGGRGAEGRERQMKVKNYEKDMDRIKRELKRIQAEATAAAKRDIFSSTTPSYEEEERSEREHLVLGVNRIEKSTDRLRNAIQKSEESNQMGAEALSELESQRRALERVDRNLTNIDEDVGTARRILLNMTRRIVTNKLILIGMIILLMGGIGLVVWLRWLK